MKNTIYALIVIACMAASANAQVVTKEQRNSKGEVVSVMVTPGQTGIQMPPDGKAGAVKIHVDPKADRIVRPDDPIFTKKQPVSSGKAYTTPLKYDKVTLPN